MQFYCLMISIALVGLDLCHLREGWDKKKSTKLIDYEQTLFFSYSLPRVEQKKKKKKIGNARKLGWG